jgi:hypothetical protein
VWRVSIGFLPSLTIFSAKGIGGYGVAWCLL